MLLFTFDDTCGSYIFPIKSVTRGSEFQNRYLTASRPMRATKMLKGLDHVSCVERLRAVTVSLLEQRKLTNVYKYLVG